MEKKKFILSGFEVIQSTEHPNYAASRCGKVFRISSGKEMAKTFNKSTGYCMVRMCHNNHARTVRVNRIMGFTWVNNPSPEVYDSINHIDGDKTNDHADNLEWCSGSQNQRHAIATGLKGKGSLLYNAELHEDEVHSICQRLEEGFLVKDLSDEFSVSKDIIRKIRAGDTYFHIRQLYVNIPCNYKTSYSESTVRWVCDKIVEGHGDAPIARMSRNTELSTIDVKRIRYKIRYKVISDEYF
ncbi:HNH nuclease [Vibrio phage 1.193.O._10N.286.52.C6]|nr:HNH nuclease [Vibrio phage 1.193.O._10N.286.52.C6]